MRKCKYSVYIPVEYIQAEGQPRRRKEGTGIWAEPVEGVFHAWGSAYEDGGDHGMGNYSVALVETAEGKMEEVIPSRITFIHPMEYIYTTETMNVGGKELETGRKGFAVWAENKTKVNY